MKIINGSIITNVKKNSDFITYTPGTKTSSNVLKIDCNTAASISLMIQSLIPTFIFEKENSLITLKVLIKISSNKLFRGVQMLIILLQVCQ